VANWGDRVLIRDSKDKAGPVLSVRFHDWRAFIRDVASGSAAGAAIEDGHGE
jgi:hypothetical protein